jgi:hypothetical protein
MAFFNSLLSISSKSCCGAGLGMFAKKSVGKTGSGTGSGGGFYL